MGKLGLHKAFRVGHDDKMIMWRSSRSQGSLMKLEDLVGYEIPEAEN